MRHGAVLLLACVVVASACTNRGERRIDTSSADATPPAIVQPIPATATDTTRPATRGADTLWLFSSSPDRDAIRAATTENLLVRQFGAANVTDDSLSGSEGEMVAGTVLFPADSTRRVEIFWDDSAPPHTRISMLRVNGSRSLWMVTPGVTLGTPLADLETINRGPFTLSGFGWDYGGTVTSWRGGTLDTLWAGADGKTPGQVGVRMGYAPGTAGSILAQVQGDHDFASSLPAMRAAKPVIVELYVTPR